MKYGILLLAIGAPFGADAQSIASFVEERSFQPDLMPSPQALFRLRAKTTVLPSKAKRWAGCFSRERGEYVREHAKSLASAMKARLSTSSKKQVVVETGFLYGKPSITSALTSLCEAGCEKVVRVPLYPIDYNPTTGVCLDSSTRILRSMAASGWRPQVVDVRGFSANPQVRKAYAAAAKDGWQPKTTSRLLVAFPSLTKSAPSSPHYLQQIDKFMETFDKAAGLKGERLKAAFMCDYDNDKWFGPFAEKTLRGWASGAVNDVRVILPMSLFEGPELAVDARVGLVHYFEANANGLNPKLTVITNVLERPDFIEALCAAIRKVL